MTTLRVLVVGRGCLVAERLEDVGHHVTPVDECDVAVEALQLQNFDAVVLGEGMPQSDLEALAKEIHALNRRSTARTAVLGIKSESNFGNSTFELDGYLPKQGSPEALSEALVGVAVRPAMAGPSQQKKTELPILNVDELKEHLDFDNELLLELIELYFSERKRQSLEMQEAFAKGDLLALSRLAHTIKGSLGSLQAPAARAEAQLLELAALNNDRDSCERLLLTFEQRLNQLEVELRSLVRSLS